MIVMMPVMLPGTDAGDARVVAGATLCGNVNRTLSFIVLEAFV